MQATNGPDTLNRSYPGGPLRGYTPVQSLFLTRLQSLVAKRQQHAGQLEATDWRLRLLDKALYSTYRDCVELGVGEQARGVLRRVRQPEAS